jgi:hypothetical protein
MKDVDADLTEALSIIAGLMYYVSGHDLREREAKILKEYCNRANSLRQKYQTLS